MNIQMHESTVTVGLPRHILSLSPGEFREIFCVNGSPDQYSDTIRQLYPDVIISEGTPVKIGKASVRKNIKISTVKKLTIDLQLINNSVQPTVAQLNPATVH